MGKSVRIELTDKEYNRAKEIKNETDNTWKEMLMENIQRPPKRYKLGPNEEQLSYVDRTSQKTSKLLIPSRRQVYGDKITVSSAASLTPGGLEDLLKTLSRYTSIDENNGAFAIRQPGSYSWEGFGAGTFVEALTVDPDNRSIPDEHHKEMGTWIGSGSKFHENTIITVTNLPNNEQITEVNVAFSSYGVPQSENFRKMTSELPVEFATTKDFYTKNVDLSRSEEILWNPEEMQYSTNYKSDNMVDVIKIDNPFDHVGEINDRLTKEELKQFSQSALESIAQRESIFAHVRASPPFPSEEVSFQIEEMTFQDLSGNRIYGNSLVVELKPLYD